MRIALPSIGASIAVLGSLVVVAACSAGDVEGTRPLRRSTRPPVESAPLGDSNAAQPGSGQAPGPSTETATPGSESGPMPEPEPEPAPGDTTPTPSPTNPTPDPDPPPSTGGTGGGPRDAGTSPPPKVDAGPGPRPQPPPLPDAGGGEVGNSVQDLCVAEVNRYRATLGLPPLARWTAAEVCTEGEAKTDSQTKEAHSAFGACKEFGQCECPDWPGPPEAIVKNCLKSMWNEGPENGDGKQHGHYIIMSSRNYKSVACGFYQMANGRYWAIQNYK
jgi:hypothetical protein